MNLGGYRMDILNRGVVVMILIRKLNLMLSDLEGENQRGMQPLR
jgi:hypothetical protein